MLVWILCYFFWPGTMALSEELAGPSLEWARSSIQSGLRELDRLASTLPRDPSCFPGQESSGLSCAEISDSFCRNLWDRNGGNQKIFDGRILLGTSPLSGISHAQMQDLQSLLASRTRLPEDLQERAADTLNKLENALKRETKGAAWKREVSDLLREFHRAEEDTASSRARTRFPKGPRGAEEEFQVHRIQAELYDQVLRAKYAEHPNWKRVEELFPQAKEDLLKAIETLPVSQEKKQRMLERVSGVRLSLPSRNPESVGANEECESTAKGAYYFPSINTVTVCAGLFNSLQSKSALVATLLHEIGHAVDPSNLGQSEYRETSPLAKMLQKLKGAKGAPIPCTEWKAGLQELLKPEDPHKKNNELEKLYSCLEPRKGLVVWNYRRIKDTAMRKAKGEISEFAREEGFTTILQAFHSKGESRVENEFYLRPDLWLLQQQRRPTERDERKEHIAEIFTQVASCETLQKGADLFTLRDSDLSKEDRGRLFKAAMASTERILRRRAEAEFTYCGHNCADLVADNSARNTNESFADWLANRALWRHFARISSSENRRQASAAAWAHLCNSSDLTREAPELAAEERRQSLEEHPEERRRRLSIYDEISSGILGCRMESAAREGFGSCEP